MVIDYDLDIYPSFKMERLLNYQNKYRNIMDIMIVPIGDKKNFINELRRVNTDYVVVIDKYFYTRFRQFQKQINMLNRYDIILPNRFHNRSITQFKNNNERLYFKWKNFFIRLFTGLMYGDLSNSNWSFRKSKILPIIESCKTDYYFVETIKRAEKIGIKIKDFPTHYIQEKESNEWFNIIKFLKELINIKKNIKK